MYRDISHLHLTDFIGSVSGEGNIVTAVSL